MENFEQLGSFYLGKRYDLAERKLGDELVLYDSKDLTTHAVCVGMTGSGKTGLCLALLEEATIDGVPAILIDPKGDLANLLLTFPELDAASFLPWVDSGEAARQEMDTDQFAAETARRWKQGLADWGQDADRIRRFRDAVDIPIYTPGSDAGLPISVLRSFDVPPKSLFDEGDAYREHVASTASGLLALLKIDADPVRSREHILISNLLDHAWREGRGMDVGLLIREIQSPPVDRVGVLDMETFYPEKDRLALAMSLNNLLASPTFAAWMEGEPLDIARLLHTPEGKPRLAILSIAHLSDPERMFFVTLLLNALIAWMRGQPGTSSLRALLYMDEVFGYFPPTANPPCKTPMLTLLKQARAYGLGVVLATQNPVDLDYRGLSNTGTWFLGRLQTERDKARVLEGLEGAAAQTGTAFDRAGMDATLAALGNRVFLMHNVHEDEPVVFQTRWVMSYLRGPLTRGQIKTLMDPSRADGIGQEEPADEPFAKHHPVETAPATEVEPSSSRPVLPAEIEECFLSSPGASSPSDPAKYRAGLIAQVRLHFSRKTYHLDQWEDRTLLAPVPVDSEDSPWETGCRVRVAEMELRNEPELGIPFEPWPASIGQSASYRSWERQLKDFVYRTQVATLWKSTKPKAVSEPGEQEGVFRARLGQMAREDRDGEIEKLREKYASKLAALKDRIASAEASLEREKSQYRKASLDSAVTFGSSILGALFGRKLASVTNVGRASSSVKSAGNAAKQKADVQQAEEKLRGYHRDLAELEDQFKADLAQVEIAHRPDGISLERIEIKPLKKDIQVEWLKVAWRKEPGR